ncbi:MAG TPA: hypothetical protein VGE33_01105 [Thermomonas sp.]
MQSTHLAPHGFPTLTYRVRPGSGSLRGRHVAEVSTISRFLVVRDFATRKEASAFLDQQKRVDQAVL